MMFLLIVLLIITLLWIAGFLFTTDFSVSTGDVRQFKHVLVVFPHADDEAITCGGSLHRLSAAGSIVTLVILTRGERGTPDATLHSGLKDIRAREAQAAIAILGISRLIQKDFGDGTLQYKKQELAAFIDNTIEQEKPDLIVTYDLAGFYGHADHITCSEIVTELQKTKFQKVTLWYVTFPKRVLAMVRQPEYIARNPRFKEKQAIPTHKIFIGTSLLAKIKACNSYKSQRESFMNGAGKLVPIWFLLSMLLFEYFAEVRAFK